MFHFGMTGTLELVKNGNSYPDHSRLLFQFDDNSALAFTSVRRLGSVTVTDNMIDFITQQKLGPDALTINFDSFRNIFRKSRAGVKSTLMNQSSMSGIGNVYSDELLFQTRLHPSTPAKHLDDQTVSNLYLTMNRVLTVAIRHNADPGRLPGTYLLPYRDEGAHCPRCKSTIIKIKVGGRPSYICPHCQKRP